MRCRQTSIFKTDIGHAKQQLTVLKNIFFENKKGGCAPGAYKARFAAWLSDDSYSEDI